jgi:hypothetical protein
MGKNRKGLDSSAEQSVTTAHRPSIPVLPLPLLDRVLTIPWSHSRLVTSLTRLQST